MSPFKSETKPAASSNTRANKMSLPPLSLYIHVPWCVRKCPYCDFNSHEIKSHKAEVYLPETDYVQALLDDLEADLSYVQGREIKTIFIGGGTPSLLSVEAYKNLLAGLQEKVTFVKDIEITMEANPGTFEAIKFEGYRKLGINRLSIGVQSFADHQLKHLGRIHDGQQAIAAIKMAKEAGFDNFNIDLMHGLPDQSEAQALADIQQAIDLGPTHMSWYQLTIEPNTEFFKRPPILPEDETLWDIQEAGQALLAKHGFSQYEVSAYAQAGKQATHNLNYWQFGDYLGIGAGAHGKVTDLMNAPESLTASPVFRTWKTRAPKDFLNAATADAKQKGKSFLAGKESIQNEDLGLEFLMNALRLQQGFDLNLFEQRTGYPLTTIASGIDTAIEKGLLEKHVLEDGSEQIKTSAKGSLFLNEILGLFM
jgi:putative oxygen-independent coproporphyrinogen III oxidase